MKRLLALLLVLTLAVLVARLAYESPGFVVIGRGAWTLETSLSVFIALLLAAFFLLYLLLQLFLHLWSLPEKVQEAWQARQQQKTHAALMDGLASLAEAQWRQAEQQLSRGSPGLLHYLAAAHAAQQRGAIEQRDHYLTRAWQQPMRSEHALGAALFQAGLYSRQGQDTVALATLKQLQERHPRHPRVLELLAETYGRLRRWHNLLELLPEMRKRKVLASGELDKLHHQGLIGMLREAAGKSPQALDTLWNNLPKAQRLNPELVAIYARELMRQERAVQADTLLREALRQQWNSELVGLYGDLRLDDPAKQLTQAEGWLKGHEADPVLLLTLGRLCLRSRLWGKAQQYLDRSLAKEARPETYLAQGELLAQIGDLNQAAEHFRRGLEQCLSRQRDLA